MKFLCEQCKAKYQIADEKIAGKTVRMKCRKCGHQIEVRAAVTETSVNTKPPPADHSDPDPTVAQLSPPVATQRQPQTKPATARMGPLATSLASARPPPRPGPDRPGGGGALAGAFQKQVEARPDDAGASFDLSELSASDEWYVAINGVPVGPIRIAEVRRKAALGAVTEDSLVWQEGLEEWRPVRAFGELAAAVREAATTGRASLLTPAPPEGRQSSIPPPAGGIRPSPPRTTGVPPRSPMRAPAPSGATLIGPSTAAAALTASAPRTAAGADYANRPPAAGSAPAEAYGRAQGAPATARSNVVPITSRLATAERLDDQTVPFLGQPVAPFVAGDPFAAPAVPAVAPPPAVGSSPFVAALTGAGAAGALPRASIFDAPQRRAPPWIAIAMIVLAAAFGVTAAIAIFFRPGPAQPTPVVIQMSGSPALPAPPPTAAPSTSDSSTSAVASASGTATKVMLAANANGTAKPGATATGASTKSGPGVDLSGLTGQRTDPSLSDNGGPSTAAPGQCLSEGQVQSVISMHYAGIKRACWERSGSTKSAANISVSLTVSPGGDATGVSATGDDPVIANCIASDVRSWHFAGGGCAQRVNIPFHFVRQ